MRSIDGGCRGAFSRRYQLLSLAVLAAGCPSASALVISRTFDATITALGNASTVMNAVNYAALQLENLYSDPVQINVTIHTVAGTGTLGGSSTGLIGFFSYGTV